MITLAQLQALCPRTHADRLAAFVQPLNDAFAEFSIDTLDAQRCFLAQVAHESGGLVYTREIWGPTPAQARYDARADLGNTLPEAIAAARAANTTPGYYYRGRGLLQTTGFWNYRATGEALGLDLIHQPALLEYPQAAARAAGWFWQAHGLGEVRDFETLTRRINGGLNGLAERVAYLRRAEDVIA